MHENLANFDVHLKRWIVNLTKQFHPFDGQADRDPICEFFKSTPAAMGALRHHDGSFKAPLVCIEN